MSQSPPHPTPVNPPAPPDGSTTTRKRRGALRRVLTAVGIALFAFALIGAVGLCGAEYYTGRPQFCGTCHVMDPYYESWSHDLHGAKIGARCIDCHYAPGERLTFRAKFKGLSQVASYFSGRYGTGRPRAHVSDESCLRSNCHGDRDFESKMFLIGEPRTEKRWVADQEIEVVRTPTVRFFHEKHLQAAKSRTETEHAIEQLTERLRATVSPEGFQRLESVARSIAASADRDALLAKAASELALDNASRVDAMQWLDLEHRRIRLAQLDGLNCASCHGYDPGGSRHFAVDRQVCYTCHFTNESFNHGTGECLRCHEAPTRSILVHERPAAGAVTPVLMDHHDIVKRKVDCASCHADVVRGDSRVMERDCTHCHDQGRYLEGFAARDTAYVEDLHAKHVHAQRARCTDCHRAVQHGLLDPLRMDDASFLQPVLSDCQHCHPRHHSEQVALLTGTGGAGIEHRTPSAMMGSRLNCRACHTHSARDMKGDLLVRATQRGCATCHGDEYIKLFDQWKGEIDGYVRESDARLAKVTAAAEAAAAAGRALPQALAERLAEARENVRLVRAGGGLHNRHFALQCLDAAREQLDEVDKALNAQ
ncbi:MAG: hypothetical protein CHACPFDD_02997 [Phycisphaerae bacterium]|nr:hypothetical protein [Phycisphaerae bacterium]